MTPLTQRPIIPLVPHLPSLPLTFLLLAASVTCGADRPSPAQATPTPAVPAGWTLVFSDEFGTPGALDPAKWSYEIGYIRNNEAQSYTSRAENVRVEGGNLVIEGRNTCGSTSRSESVLLRHLERDQLFRLRVGNLRANAEDVGAASQVAGRQFEAQLPGARLRQR